MVRNEVEKDDRKISQEHLTEKTQSIFEAIMVIGKRARQISEKNRREFDDIRKRIIEDKKEREQKRDYYSEPLEELPKFSKPERLALRELIDNELDFEYADITKIDR